MLVLDASAALEAIVARDPPPGLIERLADDGALHAPHLIDIEVLHAVRRLNALGELCEERALDARTDSAIWRSSMIGISPSATGSGYCATT